MGGAEPGFTTARLTVQPATIADAPLIHALWTDPRVMTFVGFPRGLPITLAEVEARLTHAQAYPGGRLLSARLNTTNEPIGHLKLAWPDAQGIAEPDIKLLPEYWRMGYGRELWLALVAYQFRHTGCQIVQATPNVANAGSVRLQEVAGLRRVNVALYEFPETMRTYTSPVPHYVYQLTRERWVAQSRANM